MKKRVYDVVKFNNIIGQEMIKKEIESNVVENRSKGLISISSYGIFDTRKWEEARVQIDICNKKIKFAAVYKLDEDDLGDIKDINRITKLNFDLNAIPFEAFQTFKMFLDDLIKKGIYNFKDINDEVYSMIE